MRSKILAHITGAICVGKSTLRKNLELFMLENNINNIDLIEFDKYDTLASRDVFNKSRHLWRLESQDKNKDLQKVHKIRQKYLNQDIKNNNYIILFGLHEELGTRYRFNTPLKVILVRNSLAADENSIVKSRLERDKDMEFFKKFTLEKDGLYKKFKSDYNIHQKEMENLENNFGYTQMKSKDLFEILKNLILSIGKK